MTMVNKQLSQVLKIEQWPCQQDKQPDSCCEGSVGLDWLCMCARAGWASGEKIPSYPQWASEHLRNRPQAPAAPPYTHHPIQNQDKRKQVVFLGICRPQEELKLVYLMDKWSISEAFWAQSSPTCLLPGDRWNSIRASPLPAGDKRLKYKDQLEVRPKVIHIFRKRAGSWNLKRKVTLLQSRSRGGKIIQGIFQLA